MNTEMILSHIQMRNIASVYGRGMIESDNLLRELHVKGRLWLNMPLHDDTDAGEIFEYLKEFEVTDDMLHKIWAYHRMSKEQQECTEGPYQPLRDFIEKYVAELPAIIQKEREKVEWEDVKLEIANDQIIALSQYESHHAIKKFIIAICVARFRKWKEPATK